MTQTYFDLVEHLIISSYGGPQDAEQRDIRTAIHRAYSELTTIRDWAYYSVFGRIILQGAYSAGTVRIQNTQAIHSGTGFSTVAGLQTYPKHFTLRSGARNFPVVSYDGPDRVGLGSAAASFNATPGGFTLFRSLYPLPADFRNMDEPTSEYRWWSGVYITPDEALKLERINYPAGVPLNWTIVEDPHGGGWAIKLVGYPTQTETLDFTYRRTPRAIRWSGHEAAARAGTATTVGDAFVLGTSTEFAPSMVGSIFRAGTAAAHPGAVESLNPWGAEATVAAVVEPQTLTTSPTLPVAAAFKYIITDPIDIAQHMQQAMYSACNYFLARIRGDKEDKAAQLYQRDLRLAMEQDQLAPLSGRSKNVYHDGGWRSPLKPDRGA